MPNTYFQWVQKNLMGVLLPTAQTLVTDLLVAEPFYCKSKVLAAQPQGTQCLILSYIALSHDTCDLTLFVFLNVY